MPENHLLIIALSNHSNLGPLLIPYFAREVSPGVISVEEQVSHAGKKIICLNWKDRLSLLPKATRRKSIRRNERLPVF